MLLNELNHRVKNTLATVQAIATQTFKGSALGEEATAAFHGRLAALSSAHSLLIGASWESAELRDVIEQAVSPHGGNDLDRFRIAGPSLRLGPKPALAIAMALHELCTNAAKYGALSRPEGHVGVTWTIGDDVTPPRLSIRWEESGGPEVQKPKRKGFGSRLIERLLAEELNGEIELDYRPTGVVCTVDASLPTIASTTNELV